MSNITLSSNAAGTATFTIASPGTNTNRTLTLPDTTETLMAQGTALTRGNAAATTSGSVVDFTGVPSWAKRVTVSFRNVSLSGTDGILVQLGSGTFATTGYASFSTYITTGTASVATSSSTAGFLIGLSLATRDFEGTMTFLNHNANVWVGQSIGVCASTQGIIGGGSVALGGTLDRVRITVTGTNTFDAGSVNIFWEG